MRDVASLAGVGIATVSRVVNDKPGVAAAVAERVKSAAAQLGYHHDLTASSLRRADRRTDSIGVIVGDVANPFSAAILRAVEDVATRHDSLVLIGSAEQDAIREKRLIRSLTARRVDGLIVVSDHISEELVDARQRGVAVVSVDRHIEGLTGVDSVTTDNRRGMREAVHHLYDGGHRRIAYLGDLPEIWTAQERFAGFVEGFAAIGCQLDPRLVRHNLHSEEATHAAVRELMAADSPPTAIISAQNLITISIRRELRALGRDSIIAHIGFDDFPLADLLGVSVIAPNPSDIGRTAADRLFARIDNSTEPERHVVLPTRYIPRGSGEIRRRP
ncbi:MAG: LacI family DNA-binding transcriptional regulator [Propionicimonas sp.]|uniref:LacI family DNA-binding transcriptional regulator n=1 Tax=Propionicimonas sp. TaxID=1955623 RepID=UPI002B1F5C9E|nr:LacI family DNA-binding transcriptional regulator [Propionicimonas sp.]MEA4943315.1 LacI family DNA-binding transcriptional regulator [Propionicimonas sp.]MEA5051872.1 LacI family DNA-binding transcriptional regulator [Propionicimonas sp.]